MPKLLAAAMLFFCSQSQASTGSFLLKDKKAGLRVTQELLFFLDYETDFLVNKFQFENVQSLNFYFPNETKVALSFEFKSKLKESDKASYNYYLAAETKLW